MPSHLENDPVTRIIKACHQGEEEANKIFHLLADKHQRRITLDDHTTLQLNEAQVGEFVERFSAEVEPEYWVSKRLKH